MNNNSLGLVSLLFGLLMAGIIYLTIYIKKVHTTKLVRGYYVCGAIISATGLISVFYYVSSNYRFLGIIATLLLVLFIAYIVCLLISAGVISFIELNEDDFFYKAILMKIAIIIIAILCGLYGRKFFLDAKTYDQIVLLSAVTCFNCSFWIIFIIAIICLLDKDFSILKVFSGLEILYLLPSIVGIITGIVLCVEYITIANIQEILFSWVRSPTNSASVLMGIYLWVVLLIGIVWTSFLFSFSIIHEINARRDLTIFALFNEVEDIEQFIMHLSAYSRKHKISNRDFKTILFATRDNVLNKRIKHRILTRYIEYDFEKSVKKMNEALIRELLFAEYNLRETIGLMSASEQFQKRYAEEIRKIVKSYYSSRLDKHFYHSYSAHRRRFRIMPRYNSLRNNSNAKNHIYVRTVRTKNLQINKPKVSMYDGLNTVNMVRDIYHHTKTPLRTISQAAKNMELLKDSPDKQEEYRRIITNQVSLVELILDGYRELSMGWPDSKNSENIKPYLESAAQSAAANDGKTISLLLADPFPEQLCYQGNRYAAIILKPLIDNAVEASPNGESVIVRCIETDNECIVSIENKCIITPKQKDLESPNFTTKKIGGGEGLASVRKLVEKGNFEFSIKASKETNTVKAEVIFIKTRN